MTSQRLDSGVRPGAVGPPAGYAGDPVLSVRDLEVDFASEHGIVQAVRGVSYDVHPGRTLGIAGESGSGKSATALAMMGLLPSTAAVRGSVNLAGDELVGQHDGAMSRLRGRRIAMIFQDPLSGLTPVFTIGQQITEALDIHQELTRTQATRRAVELLDLVGIPRPEERLRSYPHQLSGGMRQRVMIAMAIANDPEVIVADEPTTALDVTIQAQVLDVLRTAQRETGAAVVMITHDLGVVAGTADDALVMYAGRVVEQGAVDQVFHRPHMPYTMGLLAAVPRPDRAQAGPLVPIEGSPPQLIELPPGCPFAPRCPIATDECRTAEPALTSHADGPDHRAACIRADQIVDEGWGYAEVFPIPELPRATFADVSRESRETVLDVEDLGQHFDLTSGLFRRKIGTVKAVDGVSFDVRESETLALVGESGCGKSTLLRAIMELKQPQFGTLVVLGKRSGDLSGGQRRRLRSGLQIVFQDPVSALDPRMPVYDVLAEPMRTQGWGKDAVDTRVAELMDLVGLKHDHADRFPEQFSGGQKQRIAIARAIALKPRLVMLDEPVSALDVSIQAGVVNLLEELQARLGVSFVFVAHDLSVIRHIADRVAVMYLGRVVELGAVERVFSHPSHPYTAALLSAAPVPDPEVERERERTLLTGDLPSPTATIDGCRFKTRCPKYLTLPDADRVRCDTEEPALLGEGVVDQRRACHYPV